MSAMTKREWMAYLEKTWDAAQKEAWADQQPTKREWVGLTDGEIDILSCEMVKGYKSVNWLCKVLEAKLKEKNNA